MSLDFQFPFSFSQSLFYFLALGDVANITLNQSCPVNHIYIRINILPGLGFYRNIIVINNAVLIQFLNYLFKIINSKRKPYIFKLFPNPLLFGIPQHLCDGWIGMGYVSFAFFEKQYPIVCGLKKAPIALFRFC